MTETFDDFYRAHHRRIANALSMTLGDSDLGVDAADEGMARAYANWAKVQAYENPSGWVYRVGLNWALSKLKRWSRRLPWVDASSTELPPVRDPKVREALMQLDVDQRAVVVLRLFLDWSVDSTAAALEVKPGTVKSRLSRALDQLGTILGERP